MRLDKLMCKGVFDGPDALRLEFGPGYSHPTVPGHVSVGDIREVLVGLVYPDRCTDKERENFEGGGDSRAALLGRHRNRRVRLVRGGSSSPRLDVEREGTFRTAATGSSEVAGVLERHLARPPVAEFRAINLWQFDRAYEDRKEASAADPSAIGPEAVAMLDEYEQTVELQEVEERLEEVRETIERVRERFGERFEVEEELRRAREERSELEPPNLTERQYELLEERDERIDEYRSELESFEEDENRERERARELDPEPPWRSRALWVGLGVGLAAMVVGLTSPERLRWVALLVPVGFGAVAWKFLTYLTDLEEVNLHNVRGDSLRRRSVETRTEMAEFRERVDHLLTHEDAEEPGELLERRSRVEELDARIDRLEGRADELAEDEQFQEARSRIESLESERARLEERRDELPDYGADLFQLENELHALGIDPEAALRARRGDETEAPEARRPFIVLRDVAAEFGCWSEGELDSKTSSLWRRMAEHALGGAFGEVFLREDGVPGGDIASEATGTEQWLENHPDERRILAGTLAMALHARTRSRDRRFETVVLEDPGASFPAAIARPLVEVFRGLGERLQIGVLERAR